MFVLRMQNSGKMFPESQKCANTSNVAGKREERRQNLDQTLGGSEGIFPW